MFRLKPVVVRELLEIGDVFELAFPGNLIISPVAHRPSLQRMGVETDRTMNVGAFTEGQRQFLEFHRNADLLRVAR